MLLTFHLYKFGVYFAKQVNQRKYFPHKYYVYSRKKQNKTITQWSFLCYASCRVTWLDTNIARITLVIT